MSNHSSPSGNYPGGHVKFLFDMHVDCITNIPCSLPNGRVVDAILAKEHPSDKYDPTWSLTFSIGANQGITDVDEVGITTKETALDLISLVLGVSIKNVRLVCHSLVPRLGEGAIAHLIMPPINATGSGCGTGLPLTPVGIQDLQDTLTAHWSIHWASLSLFRHAIATDDSVVQFLLLYLILYDIHRNQDAVDAFIVGLEPSTPQSPSPFKKGQETIYTRLRNQLTHRTAIPARETEAEIKNHLDRFRAIVQRAVRSQL